MRKEMYQVYSRRILKIALMLLGITAPIWLPVYYLQLSTQSLITGLVAMSFILLVGYGGMISLAQMSFFAMAGYVIGIGAMDWNWPFEMLIPLAIIGSIALSAIFGIIAVRARGIYFLMMTLALAQLFYGVALQWASVTHGYNGIAGISRPSFSGISLIEPTPMYYVAFATTILCYLLLSIIVRSPFGIALQGIRDNSTRMEALGFNVQVHRFLAIVISGAVAGIAGVLGVFFSGVVTPHTADLSAAMLVVLASLVGGTSKLEGGLLGAFVTVLLMSFASQLTSHYWTIVGLVFILVVLFMPNGLLGHKAYQIALYKSKQKKTIQDRELIESVSVVGSLSAEDSRVTRVTTGDYGDKRTKNS